MIAEDSVKTTLRLPVEFHEELRIVLAKRRIRSLQQAAEEALRQWARSDAAPGPRPVAVPTSATLPGATKEEQALAQQFLDFVRSGDDTAVQMVKHALELHSKKQKASRKRSSA